VPPAARSIRRMPALGFRGSLVVVPPVQVQGSWLRSGGGVLPASGCARCPRGPEADSLRTCRTGPPTVCCRPSTDIAFYAMVGGNLRQTGRRVARHCLTPGAPGRRDRARPRATRHSARSLCSPERASREHRPPRSARCGRTSVVPRTRTCSAMAATCNYSASTLLASALVLQYVV